MKQQEPKQISLSEEENIEIKLKTMSQIKITDFKIPDFKIPEIKHELDVSKLNNIYASIDETKSQSFKELETSIVTQQMLGNGLDSRLKELISEIQTACQKDKDISKTQIAFQKDKDISKLKKLCVEKEYIYSITYIDIEDIINTTLFAKEKFKYALAGILSKIKFDDLKKEDLSEYDIHQVVKLPSVIILPEKSNKTNIKKCDDNKEKNLSSEKTGYILPNEISLLIAENVAQSYIIEDFSSIIEWITESKNRKRNSKFFKKFEAPLHKLNKDTDNHTSNIQESQNYVKDFEYNNPSNCQKTIKSLLSKNSWAEKILAQAQAQAQAKEKSKD